MYENRDREVTLHPKVAKINRNEFNNTHKTKLPASENDVTIDVFDEKNIYDVYHRVVSVLTQHLDIETTVLEAMS